MDFINPGPRDRLIEPDASGTVYIHRAGDAKRKKLLRDFELAQLDKQRNDPDQAARREKQADDLVRGRKDSAVRDANAAVERLNTLRRTLTADRVEALDSARNMSNAIEASIQLAEAEECSRRLRELPAALDRAKSALADAREALARHDAHVAALAAQRVADAEVKQADDEKRRRAQAAADIAFAQVMAEDDATKPTTVKGKAR